MEEKTTEELLDDVIREQLDDISTMGAENDARPKAIANVVDLYKLRFEEKKLKYEYELKREQLDEDAVKRMDCKLEQRKDRVVKIIMDSAGIVIPLAAYAGFFILGLKFEQGGNMFTSQTFKGLMHHFKPTGK